VTRMFAFLVGMAIALSAAPAGAANRLPLWSDSFERGGVVYPYTMVGRDPRWPGTTSVRAVLVPLRFVLPPQAHLGTTTFDASADLVDGRTAIQGILDSPIFTPYPFTIGGQTIGTTQFVDAYMRANFWSQLGPKHNYHLMLTPQVAPTQSIDVSAGNGGETCDGDLDPMTFTCAGVWRPTIDAGYLAAELTSLTASLGITPDALPIFVTGAVITSNHFAGAHQSAGGAPGDQTWVWSAYLPSNAYGGALPDVSVLGHELLEWASDPFSSNDVPGWPLGPVSISTWCYDRMLEVAHPLSDDASALAIAFPTGSFTFHLPDAVFLDYFTHRKSRAAGGTYSLFGGASGPSPACVGDTPYRTARVDVPNAVVTYPYGINDQGDIVGVYLGQDSKYHSFLRRHGVFSMFEVPGMAGTTTAAINDFGQIAGSYSDGTHFHAFLKIGITIETIDFPGAFHTIGLNLNAWGDVVGEYINPGGDRHGFIFRHNTFTTVDPPVGVGSAVTGINDRGDITIVGLDAANALVGAYRRTGAGLSSVRFPGNTHDTNPGAIDDWGRVAGVFATDFYRYTDGFVTLTDGSYVRLLRTDQLNGMNNHLQVVGFRDGHAFVATFPPGTGH